MRLIAPRPTGSYLNPPVLVLLLVLCQNEVAPSGALQLVSDSIEHRAVVRKLGCVEKYLAYSPRNSAEVT